MQLAAWLADAGRDKPLLLDVREPWEWETARIEGSQHIPMREVPARLAEIDRQGSGGDLPSRRPQPAGGDVSRKNGFSKVHNLQGGVDAWSRTVDPAVPLY